MVPTTFGVRRRNEASWNETLAVLCLKQGISGGPGHILVRALLDCRDHGILTRIGCSHKWFICTAWIDWHQRQTIEIIRWVQIQSLWPGCERWCVQDWPVCPQRLGILRSGAEVDKSERTCHQKREQVERASLSPVSRQITEGVCMLCQQSSHICRVLEWDQAIRSWHSALSHLLTSWGNCRVDATTGNTSHTHTHTHTLLFTTIKCLWGSSLMFLPYNHISTRNGPLHAQRLHCSIPWAAQWLPELHNAL